MKNGFKCGEYTVIDPLEHANIYQSTNDVIPTALTIAVMRLLQSLEDKINSLRQKVEELEKKKQGEVASGLYRDAGSCTIFIWDSLQYI